MNDRECELFLENLLEFGSKYVSSGTQVKRVEDSLIKICKIYGFEHIEIYAVTSLIVATIKTKEGKHFTQSVRVTKGGTDLGSSEELNRLINHPKKSKPKPFIKCIGYMLAAGSFAVFFGGNIYDGLAAALIGVFIYFMDYHFRLRNINNIVYTFTASFLAGVLAILCMYIGIGSNIDKVMIGDIMLFIPGLLLVNSIQEMFNKDIVAGLYKFIEALLTAVAIAGGYAMSMLMLGGLI